MIRGRDIIVFGIQVWNVVIGNKSKSIAKEMSRFNRVLYVNSPPDKFKKKNNLPLDEGVENTLQMEDNLKEIAPNLWSLIPKQAIEPISWLPDGKLYDFINKRNNRKFAKDIKSAIDRLNFKNYIIFNDGNMINGLHQKKLLKPATYVYYLREKFNEQTDIKKHDSRIEPLLLSKSDIVINDSSNTMEYSKQFNRYSFVIGKEYHENKSNGEINLKLTKHIWKSDVNDIYRFIQAYEGD